MWQPIESAPKDGTAILAFWNMEIDGRLIRNDDCYALARWNGHEWVSVDDEDRSYTDPTHWMPLPPAPEDNDDGN